MYTIGWQFSVLNPITVLALGFGDIGEDGLGDPHDIGLWDDGGALLASATVPAGTGGALQQSFRFVSIPSLALDPGTYLIGATIPSEADAWYYDVPLVTTIPFISYIGSAWESGTALTRPTVFGDNPEAFFGPNFLADFQGGDVHAGDVPVGEVPEPASWLTMLGGAALLAAARLRK
jgi:hypothetical protein